MLTRQCGADQHQIDGSKPPTCCRFGDRKTSTKAAIGACPTTGSRVRSQCAPLGSKHPPHRLQDTEPCSRSWSGRAKFEPHADFQSSGRSWPLWCGAWNECRSLCPKSGFWARLAVTPASRRSDCGLRCTVRRGEASAKL